MNNDIRQLSLDILRDIFGSSRRLAIYPLGHPITQETLRKPLGGLNEIFAFKHSFTIELFRNRVLAEGILLDDTVFVSGFAMEMKKHKLSNILFYSNLTIGDFYHFLSLLVSKPGPYEDNVARILKTKNVTTIVVNWENPPRLFHFDTTDVSRDPAQFDLLKRVKEILHDKPNIIAQYYLGRLNNDDDILDDIGIDFRLAFLAKYFRESLLHLEKEKGLKLIENAILSTNWLDDSVNSQAVVGLKRLFEDYLSENQDEEILTAVYKLVKSVGAHDIIINQAFHKSAYLKLKSIQESEAIVDTLKCSDLSSLDPSQFKKTLFKLASSGQKNYIRDIIDQLFRSLSLAEPEQRQRPVAFISLAAEVLVNGGFFDEFDHICKESIRLVLLPTEAVEPVELMAEILRISLKNGRWRNFKVLGRTLRGVCDDRLQSDSKRKLASDHIIELTQSDLLYRTASELSEQAKSDNASEFFEGLGSMGSKEIIRMLAGKLTHPDINIRSRMVKLLASMKSDSAVVLTEMLSEMMAGVNNGVVSDEQWYYFRNILRVLKEVKAVEAMPYLETLASWPVARLKIEVIRTLEGLPPEVTVDLLGELSAEYDGEVKKAAIIAMGLSGDNNMIPVLYERFKIDPEIRQAALASLGRIGSEQARDLLISIFEDNSLTKEMGISRRESDQLRAIIIKALSVIGDETSQQKISEYSHQSRDKSIFRGDLLSNTAKMILGSKSK